MLRKLMLLRLLRSPRLWRRVPGPVRHFGWVTLAAGIFGVGVSTPPRDAGEVVAFTLGAWVLLCALVTLLVTSRLSAGRRVPRVVGAVAFVVGAVLTITHAPSVAMFGFVLIGLVSGSAGLVACLYPIRAVRPSYAR
ncbi:hypothetical protein ACTHRK_17225 [Dietzia cercidiphylli]|uniref:hypothetical protein n=1 Tax=Dietzia cercidiphylli TaxID=498199 RepID=UPI003F7D177A